MPSFKEMLSSSSATRTSANSPFSDGSDWYDGAWSNNDNTVRIRDRDPLIGEEPAAGIHLRAKQGYQFTVKLEFELPEDGWYNIQELDPDPSGNVWDSYDSERTNDGFFSTNAAQQVAVLTLRNGDYLSIDVSGETSNVANFRVVKNGTQRDFESYPRGDGPFEMPIWITLESVRQLDNSESTEWAVQRTWPMFSDGGQLVLWEQTTRYYTWSSGNWGWTDEATRYSGGGNGYLRAIYGTGQGTYYLEPNEYLWIPESYFDWLASGGNGTNVPYGTWSNHQTQWQWQVTDMAGAISWGDSYYNTYSTLYESEEQGNDTEDDPVPWQDDEDEDSESEEQVVPRPPWREGEAMPTTLREIYNDYHAGRTGGLNSSDMTPFYQFLLYQKASGPRGYDWKDANTVEIIDHSEVDAGWYDIINNEENLDITGAIRMVPKQNAVIRLQMYSSDLGTLDVVLDGREPTYEDHIDIDVDQNVDGITHLSVTSEGVNLIDEGSGFNQNFEIHLVGYTMYRQDENGNWEEDETITPPDPDDVTVVIPPFNWGDLILVTLLTLGALYATAWILKRSGGASNG